MTIALSLSAPPLCLSVSVSVSGTSVSLSDLCLTRVSLSFPPVSRCRCIKFLPEKQLLLTGSWDRTVKLWDLRSPQPVATLPQSERVYCMDARGQVLVVGLAGRKFAIYDLNSGQKVQEIDSPLQYQTRCCAVFHDCAGFAIGGIEGRVALEYFDEMHLRGKQCTCVCLCLPVSLCVSVCVSVCVSLSVWCGGY